MSVANSYARALYEAAKDAKSSDAGLSQMEEQLNQFKAILSESKDFRIALISPVATMREKVAIVEEIAKKLNYLPLVSQFLVLLTRKNRFEQFVEICQAFAAVRLISEGGVSGHLVSAEPMSEADISNLAKAFSQKLGKKIAFQVSTEPSLLAGLKVTVNGVTYDGTLRSQIQKLRDYFVAGLPGAHV